MDRIMMSRSDVGVTTRSTDSYMLMINWMSVRASSISRRKHKGPEVLVTLHNLLCDLQHIDKSLSSHIELPMNGSIEDS